MPTSEKNDILLYQADDGQTRLEVHLEKESVWLTQAQLANLFAVKTPAVNKHLKKIFLSGELKEKAVISILETTATDGKNYKTRYYNLDAIIAVGYRVNSYQATRFRQWPTLLKKDGDELFDHDRHTLENLGNEKGLLGVIFNKSQNKLHDSARLRRFTTNLGAIE